MLARVGRESPELDSVRCLSNVAQADKSKRYAAESPAVASVGAKLQMEATKAKLRI